MGASLALAGMTACTRQPTEHIMPYVRQPEELIPGRPLFFATAMTLNGVANGVLVESHEGRPTKIEGNPEHPATLGACDPFSQASVLHSTIPTARRRSASTARSVPGASSTGALRDALAQQKAKNGAGIRILTETVTSPSYGGAVARDPEAVSGGQVAPVGAGGAAQRARRCRAGIRPAGQHVLRLQQRGRRGFAGFGFPGVRPGQPALRAPVRQAAPRATKPAAR